MNVEQATHRMLERCSVLDVLHTQIAHFTEQYGSAPEIVLIHRPLRGAFVRALQQELGLPLDIAMGEPIWFNQVPVLFQPMKETLMVVRSIALGKENSL